MSVKIIGAGYGRTGTKSLQVALEQLGFDKCYHMEELILHPEDVRHWENADRGIAVDWDELFKGYQSIVDFPGTMHYQKLADYYPDAKVILTVRDPEKWYASALSTIYAFDPGLRLKLRLLFSLPFSPRARHLLRVIKLIRRSLWGCFFEGRFADKDHTIRRFNRHLDEVKSTIAAERLLVFEVRNGWEPLCAFLGKEVPTTPFPATNKQEDFRQMARDRVRTSLGSNDRQR